MSTLTVKKAAIQYEPSFSKEEALAASLEYFKGDSLAASSFVNKYALKSPKLKDGGYAELTPDAMHHRMATELALVDTSILIC